MPPDRARISPFDRGFLFADGVYEVVRSVAHTDPVSGLTNARWVAMNRHLRRLARSLRALRIDADAGELSRVADRLARESALTDAVVYFQVTRGTPAPGQPLRSHQPAGPLTPTVFAFIRPAPALDLANLQPATKRAMVQPDLRWQRCDIKSIALLASVLALGQAHAHGADEAIMLRTGPDGRALVSEGGLTNVAIADAHGRLRTPRLGTGALLPGITREVLLEHEPALIEDDLTEHDLRTAREVMLLGTTASVTSVTHLDGAPIADARPGPHALRLSALLGRLIGAAREDLPVPMTAT